MEKKRSSGGKTDSRTACGYTVRQNLKDAGCTEKVVNRFMELQDHGTQEEQLDLLFLHRRNLLNQIHLREKQIDCLDYLVYQIEKKDK